MSGSIPFDRAAEYYDETRAVTPATESAMVEAVTGELAGRRRVLEIGVGTGRIALPLRAAGADVAGVDLSLPMLRRLRSKGAAPVVAGDATRLPFHDDSFGGALAVHVLHLIPAWREAVAELVRVVRPGGVLLVSQGAWNAGGYLDVIQAFAAAAGMELRHAGLNEDAELDEELAGAGATPRDLVRITDRRRAPLRQMVERLGDGLYSFTWKLDEATRRAAAGAAAGYAEERYGPLDEPREIPTDMYWRAYDLPRA